MRGWWDRRASWRVRYLAVAAISLLLCLLFCVMVAKRELCEAAVQWAHVALRAWFGWRRVGHYEPTYYQFYAGLVGLLGLGGLFVTAWALASHRLTDAKVDRYLAARLPRHEAILPQSGSEHGRSDDGVS